tara:strand:+ start:479 stop:1195 length:717 start_codon:yes stop_codon:yes gene_type:complete
MKIGIIVLAVLSLSLFWGCSESKNSLVSMDEGSGWISLFDGTTLQGWRGYNGVEIQGSWTAENGVLQLEPISQDGVQVNIITESQYDDFDLRFEWKLEAGTNSGVMFHVGEGPRKPYLTGPEYQILDNLGFRNRKGLPVTPKEHTASHYSIEAPASDETKPIGDWNASRIVVKGNQVEYWLNDVKTAAYEMHSPKWKKQVANSKFKTWEYYASNGKGHIGLQDHGHRVWFRNLKIKVL